MVGSDEDEKGDVVILNNGNVDNSYEPTETEIEQYAEYIGMDTKEDLDLFWIAAEGIKAELPPEWKLCQRVITDINTKESRSEFYYYNMNTKTSSWEHPCDELYRKKYKDEKEKKNKEKEKKKKNIGSINLEQCRKNISPIITSPNNVNNEINDPCPVNENVIKISLAHDQNRDNDLIDRSNLTVPPPTPIDLDDHSNNKKLKNIDSAEFSQQVMRNLLKQQLRPEEHPIPHSDSNLRMESLLNSLRSKHDSRKEKLDVICPPPPPPSPRIPDINTSHSPTNKINIITNDDKISEKLKRSLKYENENSNSDNDNDNENNKTNNKIIDKNLMKMQHHFSDADNEMKDTESSSPNSPTPPMKLKFDSSIDNEKDNIRELNQYLEDEYRVEENRLREKYAKNLQNLEERFIEIIEKKQKILEDELTKHLDSIHQSTLTRFQNRSTPPSIKHSLSPPTNNESQQKPNHININDLSPNPNPLPISSNSRLSTLSPLTNTLSPNHISPKMNYTFSKKVENSNTSFSSPLSSLSNLGVQLMNLPVHLTSPINYTKIEPSKVSLRWQCLDQILVDKEVLRQCHRYIEKLKSLLNSIENRVNQNNFSKSTITSQFRYPLSSSITKFNSLSDNIASFEDFISRLEKSLLNDNQIQTTNLSQSKKTPSFSSISPHNSNSFTPSTSIAFYHKGNIKRYLSQDEDGISALLENFFITINGVFRLLNSIENYHYFNNVFSIHIEWIQSFENHIYEVNLNNRRQSLFNNCKSYSLF